MKDSSFPPRLSASADDSALRDLLNEAKSEAMAPARSARALARFEGARAAGIGAGARSRSGGVQAPLTTKMLLASIASLAVVSAIGLGWSERRATPPDAPVVARAPAIAEPSLTPRAHAPAPALADPKTIRMEDLPSAEGPIEKQLRRSTASAAPAGSSFNEELALVEAARSSLAAGDAAGCLGQLNRYDRRFSGGVFADEVVVVRVEALVARGERERARALAAAFLAKSPESPYASRIRSLLATPP